MIQINNFHQGQSKTPYLSGGAFSKSQNIDIFGQEGIARINYLPTEGDASPTGLVIGLDRASNSATTFYGVDNNGVSWVIGPSTVPHTIATKGTVGTGKCIAHWKSYLIGISGVNLVYNSTGTTWVNWDGTKTVSHSTQCLFFESSNDGKLYVASFDNIDVINEVVGQNFNPGATATNNVVKAAFTIPEGYQAVGLAELGKYLVIATLSTTDTGTESTNALTTYFFWDRANTTADYIIELPEKRMTNLLGVGGTVFVSGGDNGKIFTLTESGLQLYAQIPFDFDNNVTVQIGGLGYSSMAWWNNMLLVGVSSTDGLFPAGVYGIKDGKIAHLFLPSEQLDGSTKDILIGAIYPYDTTTVFFAWKNSTDSTYGIDKVITSGYRVPSYASYIESGFYPVGTFDQKTSFNKVIVQLARPLQTGEGVRIKYRKNINDSWTTLGTQDYTTNGAMSSLSFPGIHNLENVQIRIELTTGASSSNTPYILSVTLL